VPHRCREPCAPTKRSDDLRCVIQPVCSTRQYPTGFALYLCHDICIPFAYTLSVTCFQGHICFRQRSSFRQYQIVNASTVGSTSTLPSQPMNQIIFVRIYSGQVIYIDNVSSYGCVDQIVSDEGTDRCRNEYLQCRIEALGFDTASRCRRKGLFMESISCRKIAGPSACK
jgi:hypothetical protein